MKNNKVQRTPHPKIVLGRYIGQQIIIPQHDMIIGVEAIKGSRSGIPQVSISISAPRSIGVYREEIWKGKEDNA